MRYISLLCGFIMCLCVLLQALDGAFNPENREKCKAATGPLIEAVDNLTAFASNPEFASVPAQISPEVPSAHMLHLFNNTVCFLSPCVLCVLRYGCGSSGL